MSSITREKVDRVIEIIEQNYSDNLSRKRLADIVDINPDHLSRIFNLYTGMKLFDYIHELRIHEAKLRLIESVETIAAISSSVGFTNIRNFNRVFQKLTGLSPSEYRLLAQMNEADSETMTGSYFH